MKRALSFLSAIFLTAIAHGRPQHMVGSWFQSGQVDVLQVKNYRFAKSNEEAQYLRQQGYTCRQLGNRTLCEKLISNFSPVQQNILNSLRELAPKNAQLHPTQEPFHSIHESMSYNEWGKRQNSLVDGIIFTRLHWREITESPARVILSRDQDSEKIEFLVSENKQLIKFVTAKIGTEMNWHRYSALIYYRSLR